MAIPYNVSEQEQIFGRLKPDQKYRVVVVAPWGNEDPRRELHLLGSALQAHRWAKENNGILLKVPIEPEDWAVADPKGKLFSYLQGKK